MDRRLLRETIERQVGGSWFSICVETERDELGGHVTIQPQYIGRDDAATHFQSRAMPLATAQAIQKFLSNTGGHLMPSLQPQDPDQAVLRFNVEMAERFAVRADMRECTLERSLYALAESGELNTGPGRSR